MYVDKLQTCSRKCLKDGIGVDDQKGREVVLVPLILKVTPKAQESLSQIQNPTADYSDNKE